MTHSAIQTPQTPAALPGTVERARGRLLEAVIEPVLATMGYELVHIEWSPSGRRHRLVVYVDHPRGIGLDDCARLSPILSNALDAAEVADGGAAPDGSTVGIPTGAPMGGDLARLLAGPYVLEVSSPGLERPLSRRSHFARFVGHTIKLRVFSPLAPGDSQRNFHGQIEAVLPDPDQPDDDRTGTVCLRDSDGDREHRIPIARVRRAHLVYEG